MRIDYEALRRDLMDYFGTAMGFFPVAVMDLSEVESASDEELLEIARKNRINLSKYELDSFDFER